MVNITKRNNRYTFNPVAGWIIWALFTALLIFLASKHEPWGDEYIVWFMCKKMNLVQLWQAMRTEGHFMLWHLLIYPFVKLGCSYWCLQFMSVALVSAAGWLIVMKSPFNLFSKCLVLFSTPLVYDFAVIARCYALIPLILFAIATVYPKQKEKPFLYCILVGLLSLTHVYMEGMVAALFLLYCYEQIYLPNKSGEPVRKYIAAAGVTILVVLVAFLQVAGSLNFSMEITTPVDTVRTIAYKFFAQAYYFSPLSGSIDQGAYHSPAGILVTAILIASVIVCLYLTLRDRNEWKLAFLLFLSIGWQIAFSLFIFRFEHERLFLPLMILYFVIWQANNKKYITVLLLCLFLLTLRMGELKRDVNEVYSSDTMVYERVYNLVDEGESIYVSAIGDPLLTELAFKDKYDYLTETPKDRHTLHSPEVLSMNELDTLFSSSKNKNRVYYFSSRPYDNVPDGYSISLCLYTPSNYHLKYLYMIEKH